MDSAEHRKPQDWPSGPLRTDSAAGRVDIWRIDLQAAPEVVSAWKCRLETDEQHRAERYRFDKHRRRFIVCRWAQRSILARYLDETPDTLRFQYAGRGKPSLSGPWSNSQLQFNVSNSGDMALCAVTCGDEVGVDLEELRPLRSLEGMAEHYFAESEVSALRELGPDDRERAFFAAWTRKESLLKATGKGLSFPLRDVEVSLAPHDLCAVRKFGPDAPAGSGAWSLIHLEPGAGYLGALAIQQTVQELRCWTWKES